jgi:hypothetical protein
MCSRGRSAGATGALGHHRPLAFSGMRAFAQRLGERSADEHDEDP